MHGGQSPSAICEHPHCPDGLQSCRALQHGVPLIYVLIRVVVSKTTFTSLQHLALPSDASNTNPAKSNFPNLLYVFLNGLLRTHEDSVMMIPWRTCPSMALIAPILFEQKAHIWCKLESLSGLRRDIQREK
jgi:hypothetical protein